MRFPFFPPSHSQWCWGFWITAGLAILSLTSAAIPCLGGEWKLVWQDEFNKDGKPDPRIGLEAMLQAIDVHNSGALKDTPIEEHFAALVALAERKNLTALREALKQRYPGKVA